LPTIDIEYEEFERLLGIRLERNMEKVNDILTFVKAEVKLFDEKAGMMSVELKDTGRPDLWNIEGLVRALRGFLGLQTGLREYRVGKSLIEIEVDERLINIRPYIGCSIVKDLKLTDAIIRGFMHMQDKLDQSYGRNRQRTSIGLYNFDLIRSPLRYSVAKPMEISFVPLGFEEKMSLNEILSRHPKGLEYGHIVDKHSVYPILLDAEGKVLSFPPIINSNDLGKISEQTRNVLVEVTGTSLDAVLSVVKIVTASLVDRGGKAYSATVHYPKKDKPLVTPSFRTQTFTLDVGYLNSVLGLRLTAKQVAALLPKAECEPLDTKGDKIVVSVPAYRVDVMHQADLIEDVAIAYGYGKIKPLWRRLPTTGGVRPEQHLLDVARELMVGLGFQEILAYALTNPETLFAKMNCKEDRIVEVVNPKVVTMTCLRNWLLPSLMEFLSSNPSVEYPQRIFSLDKVTLVDEKKDTQTKDETRLAAIACHANAGFSEIKADVDALLLNLGLEWQIGKAKHPSFIEGRMGTVTVNGLNVGIVGETSPKVLTAWKLENPAAAFELNMDAVAAIKTKH
jgi:phenylalanyl-tRNA synthetase beta chain